MEIMIGLAVAAGLGIWYLSRRKVEDVEPPEGTPDFFPDIPTVKTDPELNSEDALGDSLDSEQRRLSDEAAKAVSAYERVLAQTQAQSILEPSTPYYSEFAAQKEMEAQVARAEYEAELRDKLAIRQTSMERATRDANAAWMQYYGAYIKYIELEREVDKINIEIQGINQLKMQTEDIALQRNYAGRIQSLKIKWDGARSLAAEAHNAAARLKTSAVHTVSNANDCRLLVEDTLDEIRTTGLLVDLLNRVDAIAKATRTKLGEIESKMSEYAL